MSLFPKTLESMSPEALKEMILLRADIIRLNLGLM